MYVSAHYRSPVGELTLCCRGDSLVGLWIEGQKYFGASISGEMEPGETPVLALTRDWLDRYFAGEQPSPKELPLAPEGSEFRQEVWKLLCQIPCGQVTTYRAIAKKIAAGRGRETLSCQAVGGAVGHNPISIIIPCHRVVGSSGSLTGYAGGLSKKLQLLAHEGVDVTRLSLPRRGTAL